MAPTIKVLLKMIFAMASVCTNFQTACITRAVGGWASGTDQALPQTCRTISLYLPTTETENLCRSTNSRQVQEGN